MKEYPSSAEFRRDLANSLESKADYDPALLADSSARVNVYLDASKIRAELIRDMERGKSNIWKPARSSDSAARILLPEYTWIRRDLAVGLRKAASVRVTMNEFSGAAELNNQALEIYRKLVEQNPQVTTFTREFKRAVELADKIAKDAKP